MPMAPMLVRLTVTLAGVALSTSIMSAQQPARPGTAVKTIRQLAKPAARRVVHEIRSLINGVVVKSDQTPLPSASIRLRNLDINSIERLATANALGEFTFVIAPAVPYVVEIVDDAGRTIAVGDVILVAAGEVAGTRLVVPSGLPPLASVYADTALAVVTAAIGTDLQVVDPSLPKLSPTR